MQLDTYVMFGLSILDHFVLFTFGNDEMIKTIWNENG